MNAVILVAGKEKKLLPYTSQMHQCLFRLSDNKSILEDMLGKLVSINKISQIIIVVGHKKELIYEELKEIKKKLKFKKIVCVENDEFLSTNVIYSLWLVRKYLLKPFLLIDGDIICEKELLLKLASSKSCKDNLLLVDFDYKLKNSDNKVKIANNRIVRIGKRVVLTQDAKFGRSVGIGKLSSGNRLFVKRMDDMIRSGQKKLIYEDVLDELLPVYNFRPVPTYGYNWMEVDSIEEFKRMNSIFSALDKLKDKAISLGATMAFPIDPQEIVFDPKVTLFCYKCTNYCKKWTCPPRIPKIDYPKMLLSYKKGLIVALKSSVKNDFQEVRRESTRRLHMILLELEKFAFSQSYHYANSFIGGSCKICVDCPDKCRFPNMARMPLEAAGVDVVKTVAKLGLKLKFPIVDSFYRIGLLMVG